MTSVSFGASRPSSSHTEWMDRKRHATDDLIDCQSPKKKMYHVILESDSDLPTDESSESVYSVQDKETDFARDTSDTSTHSDNSYSRMNDFIEFEVVSESEVEENPLGDVGALSSGAEECFQKHRGKSPILTLYVEEDLELWADSSDSSSRGSFDIEIPKADYWTCLQCKSKNNNPLFRYCEKCFQLCAICKKKKEFQCFVYCLKCFKVRKSFFPERPKKRRPRRRTTTTTTTTTKRTCLEDNNRRGTKRKLSHSSSSSEESQEPSLFIKRRREIIYVGNNPKTSDTKIASEQETNENETSENTSKQSNKSTSENNPTSNSQDTGSLSQDSAICLSNEESPADSKTPVLICSQSVTDITRTPNSTQPTSSKSELGHSELGMCIMCMIRPKNGIYIHPNGTSHLCCCYECAHRIWLTTKKCPICNGKIANISKVFLY